MKVGKLKAENHAHRVYDHSVNSLTSGCSGTTRVGAEIVRSREKYSKRSESGYKFGEEFKLKLKVWSCRRLLQSQLGYLLSESVVSG